MASSNRKPNLKELRTTLNVLSKLDCTVPQSLLVLLSDRIREMESMRLTRRLSRMSEEELIRYGNRQRSTLRVLLADGRLIQCRTNEETFLLALHEIGTERLQNIEYRIHRVPFFLPDETGLRRRIHNYTLLQPGLFFYARTTAAEKRTLLLHLDNLFQLGWDVSVV